MASNASTTSTPTTAAASGRRVHVTPAAAVSDTSTGQTQGMIRQSAIVDRSPHMCGTLMRAQPRSGSAVHHHGEQDTVVYAVSGEGAIVSEGGKKVCIFLFSDFCPGGGGAFPTGV